MTLQTVAPPRRPRRRRPARLAAMTALAAGAALAGGLSAPDRADAAACSSFANMTVGAGGGIAGIPVTGVDCLDVGNGEVEIDNPRFLSAQAVEIRGKMVLSLDRTEMRQKTAGLPLVAAVKNSGDDFVPFIAGTLAVRRGELCDLSNTLPGTGGPGQPGFGVLTPEGLPLDLRTGDESRLVLQQANCRQAVILDVTEPALKTVAKLLKFSLDTKLSTPGGTSVRIPTAFGLDEARGGRIFGVLGMRIPLPVGSSAVVAGTGVEVSRLEGLKPTNVTLIYNGKFPLFPGVKLANPGVTIDPVGNRYGAGLLLLLPGNFAVGGTFNLEEGAFKQLGADVRLPAPGLFLGPTLGGTTLESFGATFTRGGAARPGVLGTLASSTAGRFDGRASLSLGPIIVTPAGSISALVADIDMTISGPAIQFKGSAEALGRLLKLGDARILLAANPFRVEAEANVAFPSTNAAIVRGRMFMGITGSAFTALGTVVFQIPEPVPVVGGQVLGGVSAIASDRAIGGVITVDPPVIKPLTIGAAFVRPLGSGGFEIIRSITPFITVQPQPLSLNERVSGQAAKGANAVGDVAFDVATLTGQSLIEVGGATKSVSIIGPDGKRVKTYALPSGGAGVNLAVAGLKAGRHIARGTGITSVSVSSIDATPYLDPAEGYGTRARPPVTAGQTVNVCWNIPHAPAGAQVDLFEDQNGFAATGRDIARDLPAAGCFDVPTAGLEPGKHWVYGVVHAGDAPLSARYWPIAITVKDPGRAKAPTGLRAKRTTDGALVTWKKVPGVSGYVVTATPVDPQDAPVTKVTVPILAKPQATLSLRGAARWHVSVQSVGLDDRVGNISKEITTGALEPVVLAGTPNGTPQVGKPWAFQLELDNVRSLKVLASPKGTKLNRRTGLLTWTPKAAAGRAAPQKLKVRACGSARRCITQEWYLSAYGTGFAPAGPARGFEVLDSVVTPGETIELRAQGIDQAVKVRIDGRRVKARVLDEQTVSVTLPKRLAAGPHDVSLRIGQDLEETLSGALVVLN
ncbi:MAG: hypothetical protein JHC74_02060 [Thermoleophilia bacterium]|nr:hypothetical protein [Thermoleophilia bacterium]